MNQRVLLCTMVLLCGAARLASAGSIGANVSNVRVGDLKVTGAAVQAQTWTVAQGRIEVELQLRGASAATTIDVLALGVPAEEYDTFRQLAVVNKEPGEDPRATASVGGKALPAATVTKGPGVRARWRLGDAAAGEVKVALAWEIPAAGADEAPARGPRVAEFCIDAGTQRALKKADGFLRVDLVLSADMAQEPTLRLKRGDMPISLCAQAVKKIDKQTFEVRGRQNLKDRGGVLPVLFGMRI